MRRSINKFPGSLIGGDLNAVPFTNADGTTGTDLYLKADKVGEAFAGDLSQQAQALIAAEQRPFSASSFTDVTTAAAWHTIPVYGVVAGQDKAIPPALERWEYQRADAREVIEVPGASHVVMISHPGIVANLIEQAARDNG